jgi:hypothetical protein
MAYDIWANGLPIEHVMGAQLFSFALAALFAYWVVNAGARQTGRSVARYATVEASCYDARPGLKS